MMMSTRLAAPMLRYSVALVGAVLTGDVAALPPGVPATISPEARAAFARLPDRDDLAALPLREDAAGWDKVRSDIESAFSAGNDALLRRYQPRIAARDLGGVPVLDIRPAGWTDDGKILVYAHGGAYTLGSARSTLGSAVPVAHDTGLRVISVDYTLAPEAGYRQVTDEVVRVVTALQEQGYGLDDIALFGDSAGGGLVAGVALKMRDQGLGMPAALVLWSPWSDITETGDTYYTLRDFEPTYYYDRHLRISADAYAPPAEQKHPYVSPVYGDYAQGFPPTLIQGGTREIFLSNFVRQYQVIDSAGGIAKLDLYEGMWHVFQLADVPEARLARQKVKAFLDRYLRRD